MSYPNVQIVDSTDFIVSGTVDYASIFCSNDDYSATPNTTWSASSRGACLVTGISAVVKTPAGDVQATPYSSSGTSYSQFSVTSTGNNTFEVSRRVTGAEDEIPADHVEPAEAQK